MKINLNLKLVGLNSKPFYLDPSKGEELTLKEAIKLAALTEYQEEKEDGVKKFNNFMIAKRVMESEDFVEMSSEEISTVKKKAAKRFGTEVYGSFCLCLESAPLQSV